jgi:hypothetical protein
MKRMHIKTLFDLQVELVDRFGDELTALKHSIASMQRMQMILYRMLEQTGQLLNETDERES